MSTDWGRHLLFNLERISSRQHSIYAGTVQLLALGDQLRTWSARDQSTRTLAQRHDPAASHPRGCCELKPITYAGLLSGRMWRCHRCGLYAVKFLLPLPFCPWAGYTSWKFKTDHCRRIDRSSFAYKALENFVESGRRCWWSCRNIATSRKIWLSYWGPVDILHSIREKLLCVGKPSFQVT